MTKEKVGFIGLGIMGKPMALNLINAGYSLFVLEKNSASGELVKAGARAFRTPKEVALNSSVVITMLPDSPEVKEIVLGKDGVLEGIQEGSLFIDMSTIAPSTSQEIYEAFKVKGIEALDAPVSGGQAGAEQGTLSIMAGGNENAFLRAKPLFGVMGKTVTLIGGAGAGQITKVCNQIIVGITIQAVAEALTLAKKAGVDVEKVRTALLGGFAQSEILKKHGERILERNFKAGFKVRLHRKDMNIVLQAGREYSVPLPGSALVSVNMDSLLAQGKGELDHSALALLAEQLSGLENY
jgi:2-hydroxy-3-oxopropionate reductase